MHKKEAGVPQALHGLLPVIVLVVARCQRHYPLVRPRYAATRDRGGDMVKLHRPLARYEAGQ